MFLDRHRGALSRRPIRVLAATALLCAPALVVAASALATPAALHLNAVVFDVHSSNGVFSSKERLTQGSTPVGEDFSRCAPISKGTSRCVGSYRLTHGTLQIAGTIPAPSNVNRLTIVGGTGTYKGARGTVLTEYNKAGTRAKETLTLK